MKNLLTALQEGRLIELPVNDKNKALEYLALIIEAIPDIVTSTDIVKDVLESEKNSNSSINMGIACPHIHTKNDGSLFCAVGWSPQGIDYGADDGKKVHIIVMYFIPDSQRGAYLKEISGFAKAVAETGGLSAIEEFTDIQSVRNQLLDWVEISIEKAIPISKARMIKLEAREAAIEAVQPTIPERVSRRLSFIPFFIISGINEGIVVLSQDQFFTETAEKSSELAKMVIENTHIEWNGYQINVSTSKQLSKNRVLFECIAVK